MDTDVFFHGLGGGAVLAAAFALARAILEYLSRRGERRLDQEERRRTDQRDAEARLERLLQDRLSDADRRLERCEAELQAERLRRAVAENDHAVVLRAHDLLREQYAVLQAEYALLLREQQRVRVEPCPPGPPTPSD